MMIGLFSYYIWSPPPNLDHLRGIVDNYKIKIIRDTWGVPHILGERDTDTAFGLAYAHAEDDFLTIQQTLLVGRGKLATAYGKDAAPTDYIVQLLRVHDVVEENFSDGLSEETKEIIAAYVDGLNYYAALHRNEILTNDLFPVTSRDLVAYSVFQLPLFYGLDETIGELYADTRQEDVSLTTKSFNFFNRDYGSNTFSIGPSRTNDGSTYIAINSHQPWQGATTWYEAHVHSEEGWDMTGATFPTTPAIIHGHNRNLAWAFTVNHPDLTDIYVLEINPENNDQYLFDGEWHNFEIREAPLEVKILGNLRITVKEKVYWSVYGPVVRVEHGDYALRYAGYGRVDIVEQLYRMNKATNFAEWIDAMQNGAIPNFNVGYADNKGNIFYVYNAMMPIRSEQYDWSLYLPGNTSETLWTEYLPFENLPMVLNPPSGFTQNANSSPYQTTIGEGNPDPGNFSPSMGIETYMTNRAIRALDLFSNDDSITFDEFYKYKYDWTYSDKSDPANIQAMLREWVPPDDEDIKRALDIILNWDLQMRAEDAAPTLMTFILYYLYEDSESVNPSRLVGAEIDYGDLVGALEKAIDYLVANFGDLEIPWGEVNRLIHGDQDLPLGGGMDVLHAIYGELQDDGRLKGFQGDSFIQLVRFTPDGKVESFSIHQYGSATQVIQSPHYADQAPFFAERVLKPIWFDIDDVLANVEREYVPGRE